MNSNNSSDQSESQTTFYPTSIHPISSNSDLVCQEEPNSSVTEFPFDCHQLRTALDKHIKDGLNCSIYTQRQRHSCSFTIQKLLWPISTCVKDIACFFPLRIYIQVKENREEKHTHSNEELKAWDFY